MDKFKEIQLFVHVADFGSLSIAAQKLRISNAAASRFLQALEGRLGIRLVERTTRRLWLTDAGLEYYPRCVAVLAEINDADAEIADLAVNPSGVLRVTSSVSFAMMHLAPSIRELHTKYPKLTIQVITENKYHNFIEKGIDVAIRTKEYEEGSNITIRKLAVTRRVLAGSPLYFEENKPPLTPSDLSSHRMVLYSLANDPYLLKFKRRGVSSAISIAPTFESNEGQVIREAALKGAGILVQPLYIIYDDIVSGRLVPVLTDWELPPLAINIAYQSRRHQPAKIRAFVNFLIDRFAALNLERKWKDLG